MASIAAGVSRSTNAAAPGWCLAMAVVSQPGVMSSESCGIDNSVSVADGYLRQLPPSTGNVTPVMYLASSDARNNTALAMSSGSTQPIGSVCMS